MFTFGKIHSENKRKIKLATKERKKDARAWKEVQ
jgi:hypothetical protein